ncbi:MAG: hypothetical protein AMXMBFR16_10970 [Candidatus Uhrbacteria bacterium]
MNPLDFMGKEIKVGATVVYPVRRGSQMWLKSLLVEAVEVIRSTPPVFKIIGRNSDGFLTRLETPDRCVVVENGGNP